MMQNKSKPVKTLTPKQTQRRRKMVVYPLLFLTFAAVMWFIFSPSKSDKEKERQGAGLNVELPDPKREGIVGDKRNAYEQEQIRSKQGERMRSLAEFSTLIGEIDENSEDYQRQVRMAPKPPEYYEDPSRFEGGSTRSRSGAHSSVSAYQDINRQLDSFYEEPQSDPEKEAMQRQIDELTARLEEGGNRQAGIDEHLALMEKSYELAARYMPNQSAEQAPVSGEAETRSRRTKVEAVTQVSRPVVSSLVQPISDAEFVRQFSQERNFGFHTAGSAEQAADRNTIAAVVHGQQVLVDGQSVRLRTTEPMRAGRTVIPRNTVITGVGRIAGERLEITIASIECGGSIIPVEITAYDCDGQAGICIPRSMEIEAVKEITGNLGQGLGTTINLNRQSAGEQLLTDLGRGTIQGTSQYISKKAKQMKVTLKAGYRILLLPSENL